MSVMAWMGVADTFFAAPNEEGNVIVKGDLGDVVHGRRVAQRLWVVVEGDVEVGAGPVKGGVDGVEEADDREEEDNVGQWVAGCRRRTGWLAARAGQ